MERDGGLEVRSGSGDVLEDDFMHGYGVWVGFLNLCLCRKADDCNAVDELWLCVFMKEGRSVVYRS